MTIKHGQNVESCAGGRIIVPGLAKGIEVGIKSLWFAKGHFAGG